MLPNRFPPPGPAEEEDFEEEEEEYQEDYCEDVAFFNKRVAEFGAGETSLSVVDCNIAKKARLKRSEPSISALNSISVCFFSILIMFLAVQNFWANRNH